MAGPLITAGPLIIADHGRSFDHGWPHAGTPLTPAVMARAGFFHAPRPDQVMSQTDCNCQYENQPPALIRYFSRRVTTIDSDETGEEFDVVLSQWVTSGCLSKALVTVPADVKDVGP